MRQMAGAALQTAAQDTSTFNSRNCGCTFSSLFAHFPPIQLGHNIGTAISDF
jgi:hypothetical protein